MASVNYFFKSISPNFSYDDFVYGLNDIKKVAASGSVIFAKSDGSYEYAVIDYNKSGLSYADTLGNTASVHFIPGSVSTPDPGKVNIVSSDEVTVDFGTSSLSSDDLTAYFENAINTHFTSSINQGPKIYATSSYFGVVGKLSLYQSIPGSAGNTLITSGGINAQASKMGDNDAIFTQFSGGTDRTGVGQWSPTTGVMTAAGVKIFESYIQSPKHYGFLSDNFYSPPEKYLYSDSRTKIVAQLPPVSTKLATGSFRLSTNTDIYSRMFTVFTDTDVSSDIDSAEYTTL